MNTRNIPGFPDGTPNRRGGDPVSELVDLVADVDRRARYERALFSWAVVTGLSPLRIQLDASESPLDGRPASAIYGLTVGERVLVLKQYDRATVVGRADRNRWERLPLSSGVKVYDSLTPQWLVRGGELLLRGAVAPNSGSFTTSYTEISPAGGVPILPGGGVNHGYHSARVVPGGAGAPPGRLYNSGEGRLFVATTGGTAPYYLLNSSYPIGV